MVFLLLIAYLTGGLFSDARGYRQGLGTLSIFPDIQPEVCNFQAGIRNFYGISGTLLMSISYNKPEFSIAVSTINLASYYRTFCMTFVIRHTQINNLSGGIGFTFEREFIPQTRNKIAFSISTGTKPFQSLYIHGGIYGIPIRTRIPFLILIITPVGKTGVFLEGEKGLPLKLLVFQNFKLSKRIKACVSFSTSPNKLGIGILLSHEKLLFEPFSEIHDVLGQSGGVIVEYAPLKSYN